MMTMKNCMFSMVSMFSTVNMVNMMAMKSTTMIMAVVDVVCSREAKGVLAEEQLLVVCKQVVQRHLEMLFNIWKYLTI